MGSEPEQNGVSRIEAYCMLLASYNYVIKNLSRRYCLANFFALQKMSDGFLVGILFLLKVVDTIGSSSK